MSTLLARAWLWMWRWRVVPSPDEVPAKCVMIGAPHTTNWDFPLLLALTNVLGVRVSWLGKQSLFRGPMGPVMRRLGGVPIDRSAPGGMVAALAEEFARRDSLVLVVPAEGTRSRTEHWKSGFYRIALRAEVPVLLGFVDGATRSGGFGPVIALTGDPVTDMAPIREFYETKTGVRPGRFGPVRLREETPDGTPGDGASPAE